MTYKNRPDSEELYRLYVEENKSLKKIAKLFGVARATVGNWAKDDNIPLRSGSDASLKRCAKPTKDILYTLYVEEEKTTIEICEIFDVHKTTISNWLHSYNIDTRIGSDMYPAITRPTNDELYKMYIENCMTLKEIATECGTENATTVCTWLKKAGIDARSQSELQLCGKYRPTNEELYKLYIEDGRSGYYIADLFDVDAGTVMNWLRVANIKIRSMSEIKLNGKYRPTDEELYTMYITEQHSSVEIGDMFDVCNNTVARWITLSGIKMRTNSEAHTGELSEAWQGGISFLPYCPKFNDAFKEMIRDKYDRRCFLCGTSESDQMKRQMSEGKKVLRLSVHHVSYDHDCLCNDALCEFIPLCVKCHGRTNTHRQFWEKMFTYAIGYYDDYYIASNNDLPLIAKRLFDE